MPESRPLRDKETINRVDDWFMEAISMKPADRSAFIDEKAQVSVEDAMEVRKLLAGYKEFDQLLEEQASANRGNLGGNAKTPPPPEFLKEVGQYRIIEKIGEGGMGTIYLAEQSAPERQVALKLIPRYRVSDRLRDRFVAECQALAMMTHHNIAHIYEAGTTPGGDVYFAMELIDKGVPLTTFARDLALHQRIDLFLQVCAGVQHAHQRAIIHRDLKPANILVTVNDGEPMVKIIDFGLAHGADQEDTAKMPTLSGTPAYMSPELLTGEVNRGDTRWDIFSLGVLLYELLVGAHPLDLEPLNHLKLKEALEHLRTDVRPMPEQRRLKQASIGENVYVESIPIDLQYIAMKAMEPDINERYPSVNALREDIERYFQFRPVEARNGGFFYQFQRFVRRRRVPLSAAVLAFFSLVAGLVLALTNYYEAEKARHDTATTLTYLQDVLSSPNPRSQGRDVKMVEVLEQAEAGLKSKTNVSPYLNMQVRHTLAKTWFGLGQYYEAEQLITQALQEGLEHFAESNPDILRLRYDLAHITRRRGQFDRAARMFRDLHQIQRQVLGDQHQDTLRSLTGLGIAQRQRGHFDEAEIAFSESLSGQMALFGPNHPDVFVTLAGLANTYSDRRQWEKAQNHYTMVLESQTQLFGKDHPETLATRHSLGNSLNEAKDFKGAEPLFRETLEARRRVLGPTHSETLRTMYLLAECLREQKRMEEAEPLYMEALIGQRTLFGHNHTETQRTVYGLARNLGRERHYDDAADLLEESLSHIPDHSQTQPLKALRYLAGIYEYGGQLEKARDTQQRYLAFSLDRFGEYDPKTTTSRAYLGRILGKLGLREEALHVSCTALDAANVTFPGNRTLQTLLDNVRQWEANP